MESSRRTAVVATDIRTHDSQAESGAAGVKPAEGAAPSQGPADASQVMHGSNPLWASRSQQRDAITSRFEGCLLGGAGSMMRSGRRSSS